MSIPVTSSATGGHGPVRVTDLGQLVVVLPYLLGFHPRDSLVVVGVGGAGERTVGPVARLDLPEGPLGAREQAACCELVRSTVVREAASVVLLAWCGDETPGVEAPPAATTRPGGGVSAAPSSAAGPGVRAGDGPWSEGLSQAVTTLRTLAAALRGTRVDVLDAVVVHDGWVRSVLHPQEHGGTGARLPEPEDVPAVAEMVGRGLVPLRDRSARLAVVAARPHDPAARGLVAALAEARSCGAPDADAGMAAWAAVLSAGGGGISTRSAWSRVQEGSGAPAAGCGAGGDDAVLAVAVLALHDVRIRDGLLAWLVPGLLGEEGLDPDVRRASRRHLGAPPVDGDVALHALHLLLRVGPLVPDDDAAPLLAVSATVAWSLGDMVLAAALVDRAVSCEPACTLARLVGRAVEACVPFHRIRGRAGSDGIGSPRRIPPGPGAPTLGGSS